MIIAHSGSFQYRADYEGDRAPHRAVKVDFEHMCSVHVVCYLGEGLSSVEYGSALMYLIRKCDICGGTGGGEGKGPGGLPRHKMELPHYPTLFTWPDKTTPPHLQRRRK